MWTIPDSLTLIGRMNGFKAVFASDFTLGSSALLPGSALVYNAGSGAMTFTPTSLAFATPFSSSGLITANGGISGTTGSFSGAVTGSTIALGGNEAFDYDEGSFTVTITGCTTSPTATAYYTRIGKSVTLTIPQLSGTSNATTLTFTGVPASIRPASFTPYISLPVIYNNGAVVPDGGVRVDATGTLTFFNSSLNTNTFTSSNAKGVGATTSISYLLN
jgi:hypothetical protein